MGSSFRGWSPKRTSCSRRGHFSVPNRPLGPRNTLKSFKLEALEIKGTIFWNLERRTVASSLKRGSPNFRAGPYKMAGRVYMCSYAPSRPVCNVLLAPSPAWVLLLHKPHAHLAYSTHVLTHLFTCSQQWRLYGTVEGVQIKQNMTATVTDNACDNFCIQNVLVCTHKNIYMYVHKLWRVF